MTIGLEQRSYPYLLANRASWPEGTKFVNTSQPGITAADAAAFFFRFGRDYLDLKSVIIYLGNCDANANELRKGRMSPLRLAAQQMREVFGIHSQKAVLRNKLMRFEWNEFYDSSFERIERTKDFEYNLARIINVCRSRSIQVVLVRPRANRSFPAGVGRGNFIYYHYFAFPSRFMPELEHPDQRFLNAFAAYEESRFEESSLLYKEILDAADTSVARAEYPLIVAHNYAVACARQGRNDEALTLFDLLLKEPAARREIVLFNKAFVLKFKGDQAGAEACFSAAYEADSSMYRVQQGQLEAIDRLAAANSGIVRLVDMSVFCDDDFVDHCHLLSAAQEILAGMIDKALRGATILNGTAPARIEHRLFNLELALGNTAVFFDYYRTRAPLSTGQIRRDIDALRRDIGEGDSLSERALSLVSEPVAKAVKYARRHPCFADIRSLLRFPPETSLDVGRFPEYFLIRRLAPYLEAAFHEAPAATVLSAVPGLLRSGRELAKALPPEACGMRMEIPQVDSAVDKIWISRIIACARSSISGHLEQCPRVYERLKTTIFWYFREMLRWGSHSRVSMRYERMTLEFIAEALAVASWLDIKSEAGRDKEILELAKSLVRVVQIHEKYCLRFKPGGDNVALMTAYTAALYDEARTLQKAEGLLEQKGAAV